jgi:hypothetical protein
MPICVIPHGAVRVTPVGAVGVFAVQPDRLKMSVVYYRIRDIQYKLVLFVAVNGSQMRTSLNVVIVDASQLLICMTVDSLPRQPLLASSFLHSSRASSLIIDLLYAE